MSDAINPTYDLAHEDQAILRRRAIAEAMLKEAMAPIQQTSAGQHVVPITGMQGIAKLVQAMMGRSELDAVDRQTKAADAGFAQRLGQATEQYAQLRKTDPMSAFKAAMGSGIKPLMQMAMKDLNSGQMTPKDTAGLFEKFTPESIQAFQSGRGALVPHPKLVESNGQIQPMDVVRGTPAGQRTDLRTQYGPVQSGPSGIPMQFAETGEGKSFTGGNVTPERAGLQHLETAAAGATVDRLKGTHEKMLGAIDTFQRLTNMNAALAEGAKTGPLTDIKLYASKLAASMGLPIDPAASTEVLLTQLGEGVLADARKLAPVTQNDIQVLEKIKGGSVTGEKALRSLMDILERAAVKAFADYRTAYGAIPAGGPAVQAMQASFQEPSFTTTPPAVTGNRQSQVKTTGW